MRDARGLPGRASGGRRRWRAHLASGGMSDNPATGLSHADLAPSKRS
jgi:hypothetical protein